MPIQDRTNEFHTCVENIRSRSLTGRAEAKQRLLANGHAKTGGGKGEFSRMASAIGVDIAETTRKLGKLAQLAKRKTLFDDRPVEISELTYIIKQDIAGINKKIAQLQAYVKSQKAQNAKKAAGGSKQVEEHNHNVVMLLQSKLATTSMNFKDVLEIRTQNMKESKSRTEQFMYSTSAAVANQTAPPNSILFTNQRDDPRSGTKGKGRANDPDMLNLDLMSAEEGNGNGYAQMQMMEEQQNSYIQSRSTAIESIESTIAELGTIFSQLANMVAEQRETVQRIDADTFDIANNVQGAQRELLKYYSSISNNRWLILKLFGVLIIFFLVFILVT